MKGDFAGLDRTVIELSLALSLWAGAGSTPDTLASQLREWFRIAVPRRQVAQTLERMAGRGWIGAGPGVVLTPAGLDVVHGAFEGLVRQIDGGRGLWQVGLMWTLLGTGGPDETCH